MEKRNLLEDSELAESPVVAAATLGEVYAALEVLSTLDMHRLRRAAEYRCWGLGRKSLGLTAEDLVQEALKRTLEGARKWKKTVTFVAHLLATIRSVASHWGEAVERAAPTTTAADLPRGDDEDDPLENIGKHGPDTEGRAVARETVERIEAILADDELASLVLEGMKEEMTGPEMQQALSMSAKEHEATLRRLRRKVRKGMNGGNDADA